MDDASEYIIGLCKLVIEFLEPDKAIEVLNAMSNRLEDLEIWRSDFIAKNDRAPTPEEILDGFAAERWPIKMVDMMRADLDRMPLGNSEPEVLL